MPAPAASAVLSPENASRLGLAGRAARCSAAGREALCRWAGLLATAWLVGSTPSKAGWSSRGGSAWVVVPCGGTTDSLLTTGLLTDGAPGVDRLLLTTGLLTDG